MVRSVDEDLRSYPKTVCNWLNAPSRVAFSSPGFFSSLTPSGSPLGRWLLEGTFLVDQI